VYPNPFSLQDDLSGGVKFANLEPDAKVTVYTLAGEVVAEFTPRLSAFSWNCKNLFNHTVSPGIYYYTVSWDSGRQKRKGKLFLKK
jgi:hypothetical protein